MSRLIISFLLITFICSSLTTDQADNEILQSIDYGDTLTLKHIDMKCGEFGGDRQSIKIYRAQGFDNVLMANYSKITIDCNDPYNLLKTATEIKTTRISLTSSDKELIEECILQLVNNKLNRKAEPTHAGIQNSIVLNDSSIIIKDFPSDSWSKFQQLTTTLLKK